MNLFVLFKMAPDTVEELTLAEDRKSLDLDGLRFKLNDSDEHALEQALLLKEWHGGTVTVVGLEAPELDDALFTALAKGADRAVKLTGGSACVPGGAAAAAFAGFLQPAGERLPADSLILLRGQGIDDLDGEIGSYLAEILGLPYVCVVTAVTPQDGGVLVTKEFAGGLRGIFTVPLPAILGVQSAEKPPRYVPYAKVRAATKEAKIETRDMASGLESAGLMVEKLYPPEAAERAEMFEGSPDEVCDRLLAVLKEQSLI